MRCFLCLATVTILLSWLAFGALAETRDDHCVLCHSDPRLKVTNRVLADYYTKWSKSIHGLENIGCSECHGGDSRAASKAKAHFGMVMGVASKESPVNFRRIPETCSQCHQNIYDQYRKSLHFERLNDAHFEIPGPNCVTCHGSVNTTVLTVNTVKLACQDCHNKKYDLSPEVPQRAENLLANINNIRRIYNFISLKAAAGKTNPEQSEEMGEKIADLTTNWHTFDLDEMESATNEILAAVRVQYNKIKK